MGQVCRHTVNGIAGRKHSLSPGFHIGVGVGITFLAPVLVHNVLGQIPV